MGAFIPFSERDAKRRYEQEVRDRHAQGLEGPVLMEQLTKPDSQTLYFVELLAEKSEAPIALRAMINRIENMHKCKAVYRVHADRAQELTGVRHRKYLEDWCDGDDYSWLRRKRERKSRTSSTILPDESQDDVSFQHKVRKVSRETPEIVDVFGATRWRSP